MCCLKKKKKKKRKSLLSESLQLLLLSHFPTLTLMSKHLNSHAIKNTGSYSISQKVRRISFDSTKMTVSAFQYPDPKLSSRSPNECDHRQSERKKTSQKGWTEQLVLVTFCYIVHQTVPPLTHLTLIISDSDSSLLTGCAFHQSAA